MLPFKGEGGRFRTPPPFLERPSLSNSTKGGYSIWIQKPIPGIAAVPIHTRVISC